MTQQVYITGSAVSPSATVSVDNFPNPQNVAGAVSVDGTVAINGDVNVTNSTIPNSVNWQGTNYGSYWLYANGGPGNQGAAEINDVNQGIPNPAQIGNGTFANTESVKAQPVVLMLWNATSGRFQAAQCDSNGKLLVVL